MSEIKVGNVITYTNSEGKVCKAVVLECISPDYYKVMGFFGEVYTITTDNMRNLTIYSCLNDYMESYHA